jgi:hypothetical protein
MTMQYQFSQEKRRVFVKKCMARKSGVLSLDLIKKYIGLYGV